MVKGSFTLKELPRELADSRFGGINGPFVTPGRGGVGSDGLGRDMLASELGLTKDRGSLSEG